MKIRSLPAKKKGAYEEYEGSTYSRGKLLENSWANFQQIREGGVVHGILSGSAHLTGMGAPHIGSYRIFSQSMNNASERSPLWTHRLPFLTIFYRYSPSTGYPLASLLSSLTLFCLFSSLARTQHFGQSRSEISS